jgi:hypothetical protein
MQKGNMYPDVIIWNPLAGQCPHKCVYCSTNALKRYPMIESKYSGELRLDLKALGKNLGKNNTIFVCAQNDLFAKEVKPVIIEEILTVCGHFDNTYLFQTKNPNGFINWEKWYPKKTILCTTIETNRVYDQMGKTEDPYFRAIAMEQITEFRKFVTIEPIMDFDLDELICLIKMCNPEKVNIGADSKRNNLPEPSKEKLLALITELQKFTIIDRKTNLARLLK